MSSPILTVIAGANGCGKSTLTKWARAFFQHGRSFRNLPKALELADEGVLLDNSSDAGHRVVALKLEGRRMLLLEPVPDWAAFLRG